MYTMHTNYFYGNKVSEYGIEHKRVDYGTLAKAFDCVLNNEIMNKTWEICEWEQESGFVDNTEEIEALQAEIYRLDEERDILYEKDNELVNEYFCGDVQEYNKIIAQEEEISNKIEKLQEKIEELEAEQEELPECYQYYIVSDNGARILKEINEIIYYNEELDMYVWGVTHFGTSWDYVLTDIKIVDHTEN